MQWFNNLKTGHKLALAFGLCLTLATIVGATAVARMAQMNNSADLLNSDSVAGFKSLRDLTDDCKQYRLMQFASVLETNEAEDRRLETQMDSKLNEITQDFSDYEGSVTQDEDRTNINELKNRWSAYMAYHEKIIELGGKNDFKGAAQLMDGPAEQAFSQVADELETMAKWNSKRAATLAGDAHNTYLGARSIVITLLICAILLGIFMAASVTKIVVTNLFRLSRAVDGLAQGDLTVKIADDSGRDVKHADEFGALATSFEQAQTALSQLIAQARNTAEHITVSADEVSAGNQDLSQRTEEQASSLEETAASMEEMTSTVKQNADNSRQANQLASHARELAEKGGNVVGDAVSAMGEINQGSKKIAEIISVIDEIAFQTNLLALNASVEAARVGEQGRGFAVVAAEVRNLAGRSATAAKEIKSLVNDTVQKVQDGSDLVNQSGAQLNEIVAAVKKVADIIAEISAASIEQSAGIEQVNKAVMQMDQMTQQNAALVEEAAGTSASMAQLSKDLQQVVSKFKLDQSFIQTMSHQVARPIAHRAAATGTYGGGSRLSTSKTATKSAPKLHIVSHDSSSSAPSDNSNSGKDDFEEF
jgi:methyl-accepting chemotaxis protein